MVGSAIGGSGVAVGAATATPSPAATTVQAATSAPGAAGTTAAGYADVVRQVLPSGGADQHHPRDSALA